MPLLDLCSLIAVGLAVTQTVSVAQQDIEDDDLPVPPRSELIDAWRRRQEMVRTARFTWLERQFHSTAWVPNPRYAEPDRRSDRISQDSDHKKEVTETLALDGDAIEFTSNGMRREIDVQSLDIRPILLAFRPLHSRLGHLPFRHSFTSIRRYRYKGRSMMIVEEKHDSHGWKASLWLEPERDFIVGRCLLYRHGKIVVDVEVDYSKDVQWGWVPSGWRVLHGKGDGSKWESAVVTVTTYSIN